MLKWQSGDRVVYPGIGVVDIIAIEFNEQFGPRAEVYVMKLTQGSKRVTISVEKAESVLRPVVSQVEALNVLASFRCPLVEVKPMTWKKKAKPSKSKTHQSKPPGCCRCSSRTLLSKEC